jgi:2-iminobutanoate/2-iminopropanoate deaminase
VRSTVRRCNPDTMPAPGGKYSHLSILDSSWPQAVFAGQVGVHQDGTVPADIGEQARVVFDAIHRLLDSQDATPADLVALTTFVVGRANLAAFNFARDVVYDEWFPNGDFPPNTLVFVSALASEQFLVEIQGSFIRSNTTQ